MLTVIGAWLVLSAVATVVCVVILRGGSQEDMSHGRLADGIWSDRRPPSGRRNDRERLLLRAAPGS